MKPDKFILWIGRLIITAWIAVAILLVGIVWSILTTDMSDVARDLGRAVAAFNEGVAR